MAERYREMVSTPAVLEAQQHYFGKARVPAPAGQDDRLTREEAVFITTRDSFYMASVTETGWPYLQHRGGPPGFLKVLSPSELAFADFRGNRQMLSTGNVSVNDRVSLFLMDYPNKERLKIMGHARVLDAREHPDLVEKVAPPGTAAITERVFVIQVVSFDWNCPQYITPRYTAEEVEAAVAPMRARLAELEAQLASQPKVKS
ncbi:pyridoxamine 5'-phosphate oxidase family protein [Verrucomicrobium spinosum]|uniref:pyridoxamine 5'-phosphate oxidase family protein n=1 Tax=Verrucomicrobium spinosum TaxID=2736 RepID=UPI0001744B1C|nr:pyridoxamine 5'-phosphate oxidase family protein [Verrucomicrobium spinosum]